MIVERGSAGWDWLAWLECEPEQACDGTTIANAVRRWLSVNSDRFPGPYALLLDEQESTLDRRVMLLTAVTNCSECGGSGQYVGLIQIEKCRTCDGTGLVSEEQSVV